MSRGGGFTSRISKALIIPSVQDKDKARQLSQVNMNEFMVSFTLKCQERNKEFLALMNGKRKVKK